jgi:hypothetical protein
MGKSRRNVMVVDEARITNTVYLGGVKLTASAVELNLLDGVTASTAEINKLDNMSASAAELSVLDGAATGAAGFTIGAESAGNVINVGIQLNDADGAPTAMRSAVFAYLSDDANGDSIVSAAPDGGWAIGADGLLIPIVAGKAAQLICEADGDIDVNITHAGGAKTCYLVLVLPSGKLSASGAITFAA